MSTEIVWAPSPRSGMYHKIALATRSHCDHRIILDIRQSTGRDPLMDGCKRCRAIIASMKREQRQRARAEI